MLSEKSQWTQNGTMFVDLDWPLNASSPLSASAELLVLMILHFSTLKSKWQFFDHSIRRFRSWCRRAPSFSLDILWLTFVSSANISILLRNHSGKSLTKSKNSRGPKTEPWGTPLKTVAQSDEETSYRVNYVPVWGQKLYKTDENAQSVGCSSPSCYSSLANVMIIIFSIAHSLVIWRPWSRDSSALEFILSRSQSWSPDLMAKVSVLVSRPEDPGLGLGLETWSPRSRSWSQDSMLGAYACNTITIIYSSFKQVLCHQLELMQPVLWSRDHRLEARVHFVQVLVSRPKKRSWQQHWLHIRYITSFKLVSSFFVSK